MTPPSAPPEICVVADTAAVWDEGARRFAGLAQQAVQQRGRFMVALSGGSTPEGLYRELASRHLAAAPGAVSEALRVPWEQTHIFFGDERYVPHDDPQSNFRMAREALLDHVPLAAEHVHPMPTGEPNPAAAAAAYEATLARVFQAPLPRFDLILLGMGPDGHTASLFPGTDAIHETKQRVVAPWVEKFKTFRLTLTPPVINNGRQVLFLVCGATKADTLHEVLEGAYDPARLPSQIVQPVDGALTWLVDRAAAEKLGDASGNRLK